jgi:subfamily B ATP-binding cassette protein MsbA
MPWKGKCAAERVLEILDEQNPITSKVDAIKKEDFDSQLA